MTEISTKKQPVLLNPSEARKITEDARLSIEVIKRSPYYLMGCQCQECDRYSKIELAIKLLENLVENLPPGNDHYIDFF